MREQDRYLLSCTNTCSHDSASLSIVYGHLFRTRVLVFVRPEGTVQVVDTGLTFIIVGEPDVKPR
jgi:hypothetical protein